MKKITTALSFFFLALQATAQVQFIRSGSIAFERRMNQLSFYDDSEEGVWMEEMKKQFPKMVNDVYLLDFNETQSLFRLAQENAQAKYVWGRKPVETDRIIKDLKAGTVSLQREVFEETYLVKDSLQRYEWKITGETRTIAGFECRKAVTRICDSVVVVAFFSNEIMVSSGPENFGGLPGMILGLAIPRLQLTYFATRVTLTEPTAATFNQRLKGKTVSWITYRKDLEKAMSDWGKYGHKVMWTMVL